MRWAMHGGDQKLFNLPRIESDCLSMMIRAMSRRPGCHLGADHILHVPGGSQASSSRKAQVVSLFLCPSSLPSLQALR
jgi:hypothetical protein